MTIQNIIIHDTEDLGLAFAESFTHKGLPTQAFETAAEAMKFINSSKIRNLDCAIIHKDLGDYSNEGYGLVDKVVEKIHELNPTVRIGIVSGEYPNGSKHVLSLGADFYFPTNDFRLNQEWVLSQLRKGPVSPNEISRRGQAVETPPATSVSPEKWM